MNNHPFYERHIGINEQDEARMLRKIGVGSLDELIDKTLPANIRLKAPLDLPEAMDEHEFARHIAALAACGYRKFDNDLTDLVYIRPAVFTAPQTGA